MKQKIILKTIEAHTCGEPARIVVDGMPEIKGATMMDKQNYMQQHLDHLRTAIVHEPRGHKDMFGAVITEPCRKEADFGALFLNGVGYETMCGHATICVCTAAVNLGWVQVQEPETVIHLDTPSGLVTVKVRVEKGEAVSVTLQNVPSFVYSENQIIQTDSFGEIPCDVIFAGIPFAHIDADKLGIPITSQTSGELTDIAMDVLKNIHKTVEFQHPELPIDKIEYVLFYSARTESETAMGRNCVILGERQIDRSPCGTGTSARTAYLYKKGEVRMGETREHENLLGMTFSGKVIQEVTVGDYPAVINEISGRAFLTGESNYFINENDPLTFGFQLK